MLTNPPLLTLTQVALLSLMLLIPGQGFWTGVALAKHSFRLAWIFQAGCGVGVTMVYGLLNVLSETFARYVQLSTLDLIRGTVLIFIGSLTLYSAVQNQSEADAGLLKRLKGMPAWVVFSLGVGLMLINPLPYAFLTPYAPPFVSLEYHWIVYGAATEGVVFVVYTTAYYFASLTSHLAKLWYGKLLWASIACLPIYYGLSVVMKALGWGN